MTIESPFVTAIAQSVSAGQSWDQLLASILTALDADSGTIHLLGDDDVLHLAAASAGIPQVVLDTVQAVPIGKGMAGLAVERKQPVNACNIQTNTTGDVRPGARATGLQGSVVVPMLRGDQAIGALGVATRHERTFTVVEEALLLDIGRVLATRSQTP